MAFCITDLDIGGAEQALVEVVVRMVGDGNICRAIVLAPPPPPVRCRLVERLEQAGSDVVFLNARSSWTALVGTIQKLIQQLQEFRPQIIQAFLHHANVLACVAAQRVGRPPVVTGIRVAERRHNFHRWLARQTDHLAQRHVCVSQAVADFAHHTMKLPAEKLVVIPNGVDLARFRQAIPVDLSEFGVPPGCRVITSIGRLDRQKRLDWLLLQMPELIQRLPQVHLILVGEGPARSLLARLSHRLGLAHQVHFAGWQKDIPGILAASEMLLLTSAWEGMPNVVLEAMAARRPVVATACEGVSELLGDVAKDQMVKKNDGPGFITAIERFALDRSLAERIGSFNQQIAAHYSWDAAARAYQTLYRILVEK